MDLSRAIPTIRKAIQMCAVPLECYLTQNMRPRAENEDSKHTLLSEKLASFDTTLSLNGDADGRRPLWSQFLLGLTQVSPHSWFHEERAIHRRMCLCLLVSGAALPYQAWLFWKRYYTDLNLNVPDYFILEERKFLSFRKC